jgi:hypothetical protein
MYDSDMKIQDYPSKLGIASAQGRQLEIPGACERTDCCVSALEATISALLDRLSPIMATSSPQNTATKTAVQPGCDLAGRIHNFATRIDNLHDCIDDALSRLEI